MDELDVLPPLRIGTAEEAQDCLREIGELCLREELARLGFEMAVLDAFRARTRARVISVDGRRVSLAARRRQLVDAVAAFVRGWLAAGDASI